MLMTSIGVFWAFYAVAGLVLKPKALEGPIEKNPSVGVSIPATLVLKPKGLEDLEFSVSIPVSLLLEPRRSEVLKFSVLIPARNEEGVIENILKDMVAQTYKNFEVFVICHNCTDNTFGIVSRYAEVDDRIKPLRLFGEGGKAVALNYGVKRARGDVIAVFDADNRVPPDCLERAVKYFSRYDAVQSRIEASNADFSLISKLADLELAAFSEMFQKSRHTLGVNVGLGGTGEFIRREALEEVGGWDNCLTEDFALFVQLTRHGFKIGWAHDVVVYDEKVPFAYAMLKQRARWLRGHFDVMLKNFKYFFKDPLNLHYLVAPIAVIGYYFVYFLWTLAVLSVPFTAWYLPPWAWLIPSVAFFGGIAIQIAKVRRARDLLYLPLLFLYLYHWQVVFFGMFIVKDWDRAKTEHGFR